MSTVILEQDHTVFRYTVEKFEVYSGWVHTLTTDLRGEAFEEHNDNLRNGYRSRIIDNHGEDDKVET